MGAFGTPGAARSPEGGLAAAIASAGRHDNNVARSYPIRSSCVAGLSVGWAEYYTQQIVAQLRCIMSNRWSALATLL
jgi:hypothetical protein